MGTLQDALGDYALGVHRQYRPHLERCRKRFEAAMLNEEQPVTADSVEATVRACVCV